MSYLGDVGRRLRSSRALTSVFFVVAMLFGAGSAQASLVFAVTLGTGSYGFISFDTATPSTQTIINGSFDRVIYGLSFDLAGTTLYGVDSTGKLLSIGTANGAVTELASITGLSTNHILTGITFNPLTGTPYIATTNTVASSLYTLNLGTGVATLVGTQSTAPAIIDIAFNSAGTLFATNINPNLPPGGQLFSLNLATGAATLVGGLGVPLNNTQGMDFDFSTDTLYAALANGTTGWWSTINTGTGAATLLVGPPWQEMEIAIVRPSAAPEPGTLALLGLGLAGLAATRRRKQ